MKRRSPEQVVKDIERGMKVCTKCEKMRTFKFFYTQRKSPDGLLSKCIDCALEEAKQQRKIGSGRIREAHLQKKYKIGVVDYDRMFAEQGGACAVCGEEEEGYLHVDHDHTTGKVRGLLCKSCNIGLGMFKDSQGRLANAIDYLEGCKSPGSWLQYI